MFCSKICTHSLTNSLVYLSLFSRGSKGHLSQFDNIFLNNAELDKETCWHRRRNRTYDPEDQIGYFEGLAWPYYLHNLRNLRAIETPIQYMNGAQSLEANFCQILNVISQKMTNTSPSSGPHRQKCG